MIQNERRAAGLTLEELAARTGIAGPNLSRLERGRVDARQSTVDRVLRALGLTFAIVPLTPKSLEDVRDRMAAGASRLHRAGLGGRDVAARLAWKEQRGLDTQVERRLLREE